MRIFNLFIILIVVICAGGLCTTPLTSAASNSEEMESCHSMNHSAQVNEALNFEQNDKKKIDIDSSCCNEYLSNNLSDQYKVDIYAEDLQYPLQISSSNASNKFKNRSQREHDPPDLQSLHSRFLI